jgi:hypothetical protein
MHALDTSDRLLSGGALLLAAGLGWLVHPALFIVIIGLALMVAGVLRDLANRRAEAE